jgi:DHA2 family multidrug resistance protein
MSTAAPAKATTGTWIAVLAGMIGAFMSILNIQITNASLLDIEGGIGTGIDNGAWVSTAYLIGEIVVIPLTDYMVKVFSFRRVIIGGTFFFMMFSMACATAHDLGTMIVFRGIQGFSGGVLIPMAVTMVMTHLPKPQRPIGLAMFALAVTFAPAIGPTIGGYLTFNYGWQTIFFVNTLPSLAMIATLLATLEGGPMNLALLKEADWPGIITMAIGLASFQTMLEEGNKDDWFGSPFIVNLAISSVVFLSAFIVIELKVENPLLNLRLFKGRNFGVGVIAQMLVGFALFGTVYLLPQYLGQVQRYNAEQIGNVLAWTGLPQLILIPLVPKLMKSVDIRYVAFFGITLFAASCFMDIQLSYDDAGDQFLIPNIVRAVGQAFIITPQTAITLAEIAPKDAGNASGISNMLRNLGGAIGTATLQTIITKREQYHSNIIGQSVTIYREEVRERISQLTGYFLSHGVADPAAAQHQAIVAIGQIVRRQALVMGFADTFAVVGVMLAIAAVCVLLARKAKPGAAAANAH